MKKQLLLFILTLLPMLAMAQSGSCGENVTYTYNSTTKTLTIQGSGAMRDYSSSAPWYSYKDDIKTVIIEDGVTSIGYAAFSRCSGLTSITIPNSVTSIGESAFYNCSGLTSVTIPNSVTSIGEYSFYGCGGLTSIIVEGGNAFYNSNNQCNAIIETSSNQLVRGCKTTIIPNNVKSIGIGAFSSCNDLTSISIPNSVTTISPGAFDGCSDLTSVTIPNSVAYIGTDAFNGCSGLTSITIPNSVTSIGEWAFRGCSGLTSVTIPNSVTSIGDEAFCGCSKLTSITIPNSVTSIGDNAFYNCTGLTSIIVELENSKYDSRNNCNAIIESASNTLIEGCKTTIIPNSVTSIGSFAFRSCSGLTSVTIPNSVTSIGREAFRDCSSLTSITIPNSVTSIGYSAFSGCSGLTSVTIPNSVTSIENSAFSVCSGLTSVTIPNSVTSIGGAAFINCSNLTSVTIPNSVTSIGYQAFEGCSSLTSVKSKIETPFTFGSNAFKNVSSTCVLTVPKGTRDAYIAAGWTESVFKGGVVENDNVAIAMETGSGADRTMIGYSSQYSLDFTGINDVKAYIVIGFTDTKGVLMARVYVVPANTGIVLKSDVAGVEVEVPITTSDVYYANLLKPAVNNVTINPTEDIDAVNYTNLMVGKLDNEQMGFVTLPSSKAYSNKCYLQIPTAFYESATSARDGGMEMVFVDDETTDIRSLMHNGSATNDTYYDLQGRKVIPSKKGIYIKNGKKVIVK